MPNFPVTAFPITEGFFPHIYHGHQWADDEKPKYGISIKIEELPPELRPFARTSDRDGLMMVGIRSNIVPLVVPDKNSGLTSTIRCAQTANLEIDWLFTRIPLTLAVEQIEFESSGFGNRKRGEMVYMLGLRAIRVNVEDVIKRYDELCAEYFTGD